MALVFVWLIILAEIAAIYFTCGGLLPAIGAILAVVLFLLLVHFTEKSSRKRGIIVHPKSKIVLGKDNPAIIKIFDSFWKAAKKSYINPQCLTLVLSLEVDIVSIKADGKNTIIYVNPEYLKTVEEDECVALFIHEISHFQNNLAPFVSLSLKLELVAALLGVILALLTPSVIALLITLTAVFVYHRFIFCPTLKKSVYKADHFVKKMGYGDALVRFLERTAEDAEETIFMPSSSARIQRLKD